MRQKTLFILFSLSLVISCREAAVGFVAVPSDDSFENRVETADSVVEGLKPDLPAVIKSDYPNIEMVDMKGSRIFRADVGSTEKPDVAIGIKIIYTGSVASREEILELIKKEVESRLAQKSSP